MKGNESNDTAFCQLKTTQPHQLKRRKFSERVHNLIYAVKKNNPL
jgi:hypothetical protein